MFPTRPRPLVVSQSRLSCSSGLSGLSRSVSFVGSSKQSNRTSYPEKPDRPEKPDEPNEPDNPRSTKPACIIAVAQSIRERIGCALLLAVQGEIVASSFQGLVWSPTR